MNSQGIENDVFKFYCDYYGMTYKDAKAKVEIDA
jgi:hypothetical protein